MTQSREDSIKETITTVGIGYLVSFLIQLCVCKYYGLPLTARDNAIITGVFTVASLVRVYAIRRMFATHGRGLSNNREGIG